MPASHMGAGLSPGCHFQSIQFPADVLEEAEGEDAGVWALHRVGDPEETGSCMIQLLLLQPFEE